MIINFIKFLKTNKYSTQKLNNIETINYSVSKSKKKLSEIINNIKNINYIT